MSSKYTVKVINDSVENGSFCVFQTIPMQKDNQELYSLAWLTKECRPGTSRVCYWDNDYSFMFAESGQLSPGVLFDQASTIDADPDDQTKNSIGFLENDYGYLFEKTKNQTPLGSLGIYCLEVPGNTVSIGVGMGKMGVFAYTAMANFHYIIQPRGNYWVTFGEYRPGEVLDLSRVVPRALEITFPSGQDSLTVVYGKDKKLIIQ